MKEQDNFDIHEAFLKLSANLEQPHKFAEIFCNAANQQKSIDDVLTNKIIDLLDHNNKAIDRIKSIQRQVDKEDWKAFVRKIGMAGWSAVMLIVGALITGLSRKFIG